MSTSASGSIFLSGLLWDLCDESHVSRLQSLSLKAFSARIFAELRCQCESALIWKISLCLVGEEHVMLGHITNICPQVRSNAFVYVRVMTNEFMRSHAAKKSQKAISSNEHNAQSGVKGSHLKRTAFVQRPSRHSLHYCMAIAEEITSKGPLFMTRHGKLNTH